MLKRTSLGLGTLVGCLLGAGPSFAATPNLPLAPRHTENLQGGYVLAGSTMGFHCNDASNPPPPGSTVNCVGAASTTDSSPNVYWQDDTANILVAPLAARTSAMVSLPPGATVKYARLYWAGRHLSLLASTSCTLERVNGTMESVTADDDWAINANLNQESFYQSTADVTAFVAANGSGEYRVSNVDAIVLPNTAQLVTYTFSGWTLLVVYEQAGAPFASVTVYDGFDVVGDPNLSPTPSPAPLPSISAPLTFALPKSPVHHVSLGVLGYGGDVQVQGDSVSWNGAAISDAANPAANFFNSTRSSLGAFVANAADHPELSGSPLSMAAYDLDIVDVSADVAASDTSASVTAAAAPDGMSGAIDTYFLGAYVTEVRGCVAGADCTTAGKPACNLTNGDCQVCTTPDQGGDASACAGSSKGHKCEAGSGGDTAFCGCDATSDCDGGLVCDTGTHKCTMPCHSDNDCEAPTPHCDTTDGQCVQCLTDDQCPQGQHCDAMHQCTGNGSGGGGAGGSGAGGSTSSMGSANGGAGGSMGASTSSMGSANGGMSGTGTSTASMGSANGGGNADTSGVILEGGGCKCGVAGDARRAAPGAAALLGLALSALGLRRRRRPRG